MVDPIVIRSLADIRRSASEIAKFGCAAPAFHKIYVAARSAEEDHTMIGSSLEQIVLLSDAYASVQLSNSGEAHIIYGLARDAQWVINNPQKQQAPSPCTNSTQLNSARFNDNGRLIVSYNGHHYTLSIDVVRYLKNHERINAISLHRNLNGGPMEMSFAAARDMINLAEASIIRAEIPECVDDVYFAANVRRLIKNKCCIRAIAVMHEETGKELSEVTCLIMKAAAQAGLCYYMTTTSDWCYY